MTLKPNRVLYLLGSAAPPVLQLADVVTQAKNEYWDVCVGLTPTAARWLDDRLPQLAEHTGHPVRSQQQPPPPQADWPPADVAVLAPGTFNTINKWALGIADSYVLTFLTQSVGRGVPTVAVPCVNTAHLQHPQFERGLATLRAMDVRVLYGGEGGFVPREHGRGHQEPYPWGAALATADELAAAAGPPVATR